VIKLQPIVRHVVGPENKKHWLDMFVNFDTPGLTYDSGLFYDDANPPQTRRSKIMAQVILNISRLNIAALLQTANNIKTSMTGNANFTTPNPALTEITSRITALTNTNNAYELGILANSENLTLRDDAAQALIDDLTLLAGYVQTTSGGDVAKIQSAGMSVRAARTPAAVPGQVGNLSVFPSDSAGGLDLQWDPMPGTKSYEIQTSVDPITPTSWIGQPPVTKSRTSLTGFASGSKIWSRVRAVNPAGIGAWSSEIAKFVP